MLTHSNDIWCAWKETVYARVKPYFVMIFTSRTVTQLEGRHPSLPPTLLSNDPAGNIDQACTSCSSVSQFIPLSWSPYVRFVHSLFRASRAISRHQNSFRAQPPSQVLGQWRTANKNREEQQCWGENQQRLKKQEMTAILTESSSFTRFLTVCSSCALDVIPTRASSKLLYKQKRR